MLDPLLLSAVLGGAVTQVEAIAGGQSNPTYRVEMDGRPYALRKQPDGEILPSAHAVDREYRVMAALGDTEVPVPRMVRLCEDVALIGTKFYLMDWVDGRVTNDSAMPGFTQAERGAVYADAAKVLAQLHQVNWADVGLERFGRPDGFFERQIARWSKQWALSKTREDAHIDAIAKWLAENIPEQSRASIVHGDYRIGNLMVAPASGEIAAVLDWELSTIGDPMADLAHFCCFWDLDAAQLSGLADRDCAALGIPSQAEFVDDYRAHGGVDAPLLPFHRTFALFRFAIIFEGITARLNAGQASGENAAEVGALAPVVAERAYEIMTGERS
jgi:aminoglycoside phosphotransferase (APT) family kinase protein